MTFEIVKPGAPASWSREDREFREAQALRLRAGSEAVRWKRYRRLRELGYTPEGARWEIEQAAAEAEAAPEEEAPAWGITEDNSAPYIPLEIGDRHTAFEWMMLAADLDPNAPWVGIPGDTIEDMRARRTRMLALVPEVWRALERGVKGKRLEPLFWDYYRTRAGDDYQDLTTSVFDGEMMAALFRRIGRHGEKISAWLVEREQRSRIPAPTHAPLIENTIMEPATLPKRAQKEVLRGQPTCPKRLNQVDRWARSRWPDIKKVAETGDLPNRDTLISLGKEKFANFNRTDATELRRRYVPKELRRGGTPTHRSRRP